MNIATLRNMPVAELRAELQKQERLKFGLQQGLRAGEVKDYHKFRAAKKAVAQIYTLLSEKTEGGHAVE